MISNLTLLGYMGCGKSSVGNILALFLNQSFYDLDILIAEKQGYNINEIFKKKGESEFRRIEHQVLKTFLKSHTNFILSIGGGTPCYYDNMTLLNRNTQTIYLRATASVLFERLKLIKYTRPLISQLSNNVLFNFILIHLHEREFFYKKSHKLINVGYKSINQITKEIIKI